LQGRQGRQSLEFRLIPVGWYNRRKCPVHLRAGIGVLADPARIFMEQLICARGHRWEVTANGSGGDGSARQCPVCGEPHLTVVVAEPGDAADPTPPSPGAPPIAVPGCEMLGELGRGGMGVVYKARQMSLNRTVAVKMILAGPYAGAAQRDRFRIEAEAAARLHHPNIVQLFEVGEHEGRPYCLLEYVSGQSLAQLLDGTPWPARHAAELVHALGGAIHVAHALGIVHRDLKPGNILLTDDGVPKITDFGLAKILDGAAGPTVSGDLLGTPSYIAPEQADRRSRPIGPAVDVYALGAILYEVLTGRPPFKAETPLDTVLQVVNDEPVPVSRLQPKVPRDLETICMKCLEKEPRRRYGSAQELAGELGRFLNDQPIRARPVSVLARLGRWCKRNPPLALMSGLALMMLLATVVLSVTIAVQKGMVASELQEALDAQSRSVALDQLNQGLIQCERGEVAEGLLWLARSLRAAPPHEEAFQQTVRTNIAAWGRAHHPLRVVQAMPTGIGWALFSADGRVVLTAAWGAICWKWDPAVGTWHGSKLLDAVEVQAVALSEDGSTAATVRDQRLVELWDTATGQRRAAPIEYENPVSTLALSRGGRLLLCGGPDTPVELWETRERKRLGSLPLGYAIVNALFAPDERSVLTADSSGQAICWNVETQKPLATLPHEEPITALAFHPTNSALAFTAAYGGSVRFWDIGKNQVKRPVQHGQAVRALLVTSEGDTLLTASDDRTARAWRIESGQPAGPPLQHRGAVVSLAVSSDGRRVLTGSADQTARLWDLATGQPVGAPMQHQANVVGVAFGPGERTVFTAAAGSSAMLRSWHITPPPAPRQTLDHPGWLRAVCFSRDGQWLLTGTGDRGAMLWELATGKRLGGPVLDGKDVPAMALSREAGLAALVDGDSRVHLWQVGSEASPVSVLKPAGSVSAIQFSPDGRRLFIAGDQRLQVWDTIRGRLESAELKWPEPVRAVAVNAGGDRACWVTWEGISQVWEIRRGQPLGPVIRHAGAPRLLAFRDDGTQVAIASDDRTARLWDPVSGRPLGPPLRHAGPINVFALRPDGQLLLTVSEGTRVRLWNPVLGQTIGPALENNDVISTATFSPDGTTFVIANFGSALSEWAVPAPVTGETERVVLSVEILTGMFLDTGGLVHALDADGWRQRAQRLQDLGGPVLP
jgi:eukaryotic-like serine/threonine-protein kinase